MMDNILTKCGGCLCETDLTLANPALLGIYQILIHEKVVSIKLCLRCIKTLKSIEALQSKYIQSLNILKNNLLTVKVEIEESEDLEFDCTENSETVFCDHCNESVIRVKFYDHWKSKHNHEIECSYPGCGTRFKTKESAQNHNRTTHRYCNYCQTSYEHLDEKGFDEHMTKLHSFVCANCGLSMRCKQELDQHIKENHIKCEVDDLTCKVCYERFTNKKLLETHNASEHSSENIYDQQQSTTSISTQTAQAIMERIDSLEQKINISLETQSTSSGLLVNISKMLHDQGCGQQSQEEEVADEVASLVKLQKRFKPKFTTMEQIKAFENDLKSKKFFNSYVTFFQTKLSTSSPHISVKQMVVTFLDPSTRNMFTATGYGGKKSFEFEFPCIKACILATDPNITETKYKDGLVLFFQHASRVLNENETKRKLPEIGESKISRTKIIKKEGTTST